MSEHTLQHYWDRNTSQMDCGRIKLLGLHIMFLFVAWRVSIYLTLLVCVSVCVFFPLVDLNSLSVLMTCWVTSICVYLRLKYPHFKCGETALNISRYDSWSFIVFLPSISHHVVWSFVLRLQIWSIFATLLRSPNWSRTPYIVKWKALINRNVCNLKCWQMNFWKEFFTL